MTEKTKEWKKLNDFEHARKRTEMYFGSRDPHTQITLDYKDGVPFAREFTWIPSIFTAFREILDNALDEIVTHGHGSRIDINYDEETRIFKVSDNGRGIPINFDDEEQQYAATVLLSETKAGRNFDDRGNSRGMNGIGASVVNFCSEYFFLTVQRDKQNFQQYFREGDTDSDFIIDDPMITPATNSTTGTTVEFKLSERVFPVFILTEEFIKARVFEITLCYPKLKIFYNNKQIKVGRSLEKTLFPNHKPVNFVVDEEGFKSEFWLVPNFNEDGSELSHGLVNAIPAFNGGVHIDAFKSKFFSGLITALAPQSKKKKLTPNRSDIADGLFVFNITEMDSPSFDSQNKTRLITESSAAMVRKAMDDPDFFKKVIRTYPEWIEQIYERCAERTQKKDNAEVSKLAKKTLRQKVEDLEDASGRDRTNCILFLAEGKSAVSGLVEARDPNIHGGLPLRGKVLNVYEENYKKILENQTLSKIMKAIGLVPGQRANRHMLRYGKVYITTDADPDGANIAALLINFFNIWPELFDPEKPFIYVFDTPLIIAVKGKKREYWYSDNYQEFSSEKYKGWEITRAKGLAALKRDDWKHVLANPKVYPIVDDGELKDALTLLFDGTKADARKEWIGR